MSALAAIVDLAHPKPRVVPVRGRPRSDELLAYLSAHPGAMLRDIARALGWGGQNVSNHLHHLRMRNLARIEGRRPKLRYFAVPK